MRHCTSVRREHASPLRVKIIDSVPGQLDVSSSADGCGLATYPRANRWSSSEGRNKKEAKTKGYLASNLIQSRQSSHPAVASVKRSSQSVRHDFDLGHSIWNLERTTLEMQWPGGPRRFRLSHLFLAKGRDGGWKRGCSRAFSIRHLKYVV
jgi:hypothetical protein